MNQDIEKCLNLACEIEGLLHLMKNRTLANLPENVKTLLASKSAELSEMLKFVVDNDVSSDTEESGTLTSDGLHENESGDSGMFVETVGHELEEADSGDSEIDEPRKCNSEDVRLKEADGSGLMKHFTLNGQYRMARELFGGSVPAMKVILEEISVLGNIDEVSEYLSKRQGIDTATGTGKKFLNAISPFFYEKSAKNNL